MRSMSVRSDRSIKAVLMVLAGTLLSATPALAAASAVDDAQRLLEAGRVVEARSILMTLKAQGPSGAEADRVAELLASTDRRIRLMDEAELTLQKAELALSQGEIRVAESQANAVLRSDKADAPARQRASRLLDQAAELRDQLAPAIAPTLEQAIRDFDAARYPEAKAGFASIVRTGGKLTQDQVATVNRYQDRLVSLERERGAPFESDYVPLSVMNAAGHAVAAAATGAAQDQPPAASQPAPTQPQPGDDLLDEAARFDAERVLNEAEEAFKNGRYNEASEKFTLATTTYGKYLSADQMKGAQDRLAEARALLGNEGAGAADSFINTRRIQIGEATATYENLVSQARAAKDRGDIQAARNYSAQARLGWNNAYANGLFSEEQYRQRANQIDQLVRDIDAAAEAQTVAEIQRREQQLKSEESKVRAQQESERQARINENLDRLRSLQAEQKYEEALQVVEQVLFLDPTNPSALLLKDVLKDVILYREFDVARRQRGLSYAKESNEIEKALIVPESILAYPADWPELSFRRGEIQSFVESEADRKVLATLDTRRIPASFKDNSLRDVLSFVATVSNVQMDVNWDSLAQLGIDPDKQISLELREVPARVVLDRVLEKAQPDTFSKAGWAVNDGVLVVAADEALRRNTFVVIYDIRDLLFQIPDYNTGPKLDLDQVLNQGQSGGGGGGGGIFEDEDGDGEPKGLSEPQLMARVLEIIQTNVDFEGWRDNGGSTGVVQELNGNLIITNTARNHRAIQGLLSQLREIRSVQINVESRFLTVAQDFYEQIGFDLDVYFNANNDQFKAVKRQLGAFGQGTLANEGLSAYPSDIVTGRNGANRGYTFTGLDANGNPQYAFQDQPYSIPAPSPMSVIPAQQNSNNLTTSLVETSGTAFAQGLLAAGNPAIAIAGTFLDDVQVDFLIEATQADQRNVTLSAPRLTFSNGRAANISVVNQVGFVSALNPVVGAGSVAFNPTIGRINSGFTLLVRGVASADRRYVTLTVETGVSGQPSFQSQTFTAVAGQGGDNQAPAVAEGTIQIPTIDVTQVNTGVTIPDRGTVLLGGQRLANELEVETGVPVLSKLPIISRFFTNRAEVREERTLLILMKPTIIIQNEEEEKNFPGLLDKLRNPFR